MLPSANKSSHIGLMLVTYKLYDADFYKEYVSYLFYNFFLQQQQINKKYLAS